MSKERKKKNYRLLAAAIAVLAAGLVMFGVSYAFGLTDREAWVKTNAKLRTARGYYETPEIVTESYDADAFTSIDFNLVDRDFIIEAGTGDKFELTYNVNFDGEMEIGIDGETLSLKQKSFSGKNIGHFLYMDLDWVIGIFDGKWSSPDVKLIVPADFEFEKMNIKATSGDMVFDKISAEEMFVKVTSGNVKIEDSVFMKKLGFELTSGDLRIKNVIASEITIHLTSGDTNIDEVKADKLTAKPITSGNLVVSASDIKHIEFKTTSGNVTFKDMPFAVSNTEFAISVTSGNIRVGEHKQGSPYNPPNSTAEYRIEGHCTSGNFKFTSVIK